MGQSIGYWEGNTLVVEAKDMSDLTWIDWQGRPHSDALRVEQRIRRIDHDNLGINFLFDNPKTYTKPWTGKRVYKWKATEDAEGDYERYFFHCETDVREQFSEKVIGAKPRNDAR
jgi:hypothetical protein